MTALQLARELMKLPERALNMEVEIIRDGGRKRMTAQSVHLWSEVRRSNFREPAPERLVIRVAFDKEPQP